MKRSLLVLLASLVSVACFAGSAQAAPGPVVYDHVRAIPTRSGENVRITLYTNNARWTRVSVDGSKRMRGRTFGKGCGRLRCEKWKVYAVRTGEECYEVEVTAGRRTESSDAAAAVTLTACEPFRNGTV